MQIEDFSKAEFTQKLDKIIALYESKGLSENENPKAIILGGQPGAGKSVMADIFSHAMDKDVVFISGDDYRKYHPRREELKNAYGDDAVLYTQKFAGQATEALINYFSSKHYNLIIEGTLRTTSVPINTRNILKNQGYTVDLGVIMVRPEVSFLSTLKRYSLMKEFGSIPRLTPKEHHDYVVDNLIDNISYVYNQKVFDIIKVFNRESCNVYNSYDTPDINPGDIFRNEFSRKLTPKEIEDIYINFKGFVDYDTINTVLNDYNSKRFSFINFEAKTLNERKELIGELMDHCMEMFAKDFNPTKYITYLRDSNIMKDAKADIYGISSYSLLKEIVNSRKLPELFHQSKSESRSTSFSHKKPQR